MTTVVEKKTKKKIPQKLQPKTLIAASLTAITLALISSKLTGLVNSLVLVATASLLAALVSEFYHSFLTYTEKLVIKAVIKKSKEDDDLDLSEAEKSLSEDDTDVEAEDSEDQTPWRISSVLSSRWGTTVVFVATALATLVGSYALGINKEPDQNIIQHITQTRDVSPAVEKSLEDKISESSSDTLFVMRQEMELMQDQLDAIKEELSLHENETDSESREDLNAAEQIRALEQEMKRLSELIEELKAEDDGGDLPPQGETQ